MMRVERCIRARKSRIQTINADISSVVAGLVGAAFAVAVSFVASLGLARRREEELAFA
jgi:hypothetical protein